MTQSIIRPYGDTLNDGFIQLSFTLPIENDSRGRTAAKELLSKLNFNQSTIVFSESLSEGFTYFVAYAQTDVAVDTQNIQSTDVKLKELDFYQINTLIKENIQRKVTVVGATIGTDAHTVGIDAIMNMKGYNQNYGLERYPEINAVNLGAQVPYEELLASAISEKADAILVSQTVTQKDIHIHNFTQFIEIVEAHNKREDFIILAGGPRISNELAIEMGYDAGFGAGTLPAHVASFIACNIIEKMGIAI
ncbi:cobalamin-dependent protein [Bacteriovoracaceae bacterium]|nr:cobalamin-dependent protein [Bacteriovoracaceae bacterium]